MKVFKIIKTWSATQTILYLVTSSDDIDEIEDEVKYIASQDMGGYNNGYSCKWDEVEFGSGEYKNIIGINKYDEQIASLNERKCKLSQIFKTL